MATSGVIHIPDWISISSAVPTSNNAGRQMYLPAYLFIYTHTHNNTHTHTHTHTCMHIRYACMFFLWTLWKERVSSANTIALVCLYKYCSPRVTNFSVVLHYLYSYYHVLLFDLTSWYWQIFQGINMFQSISVLQLYSHWINHLWG